MKNRLLCFLLSAVLILSAVTLCASAEGAITVEVPVSISFTDAEGVDINLRLNPLLVENAEFIASSSALEGANYNCNLNESKLKVGIAFLAKTTSSGELFKLRLTLSATPGAEDELVKVLQVKVNEVKTFQANDCILLTGVANDKTYTDKVTIGFNEGTATLDGCAFESGGVVATEGSHTLCVTDLTKRVRTVNFTIDTKSVWGFTPLENTDVCYFEKYIFTKSLYNTTFADIGILSENAVLANENELFGTGAKVAIDRGSDDVYEYTLIVYCDLDGDSVCDVLDCTIAERISNNHIEPQIEQLYALNGCISEELSVDYYQNVVNVALA